MLACRSSQWWKTEPALPREGRLRRPCRLSQVSPGLPRKAKLAKEVEGGRNLCFRKPVTGVLLKEVAFEQRRLVKPCVPNTS